MANDKPPRVGVNDEDAFLGAPLRRPTGPTPFDRETDIDVEGEVALEVLPQMVRTTGTYDTVEMRNRTIRAVAIAVGVGVVVAGVIAYVLFGR